VFSEIVTFPAVAEENGMFNAAVLITMLPKFIGSRGNLQRALEVALAWCIELDHVQETALNVESGPSAVPVAEYAFPKTAERVRRMLAELQTDGFTAFG